MNLIQQISSFFDSIDQKDFYKYIGAVVAIILLSLSFLIYQFYSKVSGYNQEVATVNNEREEIQTLLEHAALIKQKKQEVNAFLESDPLFKIEGYFLEVIKKLNLGKQFKKSNVVKQERSDERYDESVLTAQFVEMNMKELCELLNEIEENKRIYTKELNIQRSKKSRTLEVQLIIATLQPRTDITETYAE